jgi:2-C-methyl-D-erythritol 4-phosphate cytidylyltransferase
MKEGTRQRNRSKYKVIQTPQCFQVSDLKKRTSKPSRKNLLMMPGS